MFSCDWPFLETMNANASSLLHIDPDNDSAVIEVGSGRTLVEQGKWSPWVEVSFDLLPMGMMPVTGSVPPFTVRVISPAVTGAPSEETLPYMTGQPG